MINVVLFNKPFIMCNSVFPAMVIWQRCLYLVCRHHQPLGQFQRVNGEAGAAPMLSNVRSTEKVFLYKGLIAQDGHLYPSVSQDVDL